MFGYVRPVRDELKCKDFDLYRATYCGLCRTLRQRYGFLAPMFLSFDFAFLALLISEPEQQWSKCSGHCHANPFKKLPMCSPSKALDDAADTSVILTYWKLRDGAKDDKAWKGLGQRLLSWMLRGSYKKASERRPDFDRTVRDCLDELELLEHEKCSSIDRIADTFARLLQGAAPETGEDRHDRPMQQLLYHVGRWIYLIDARDDLEQDRRCGAYNPLVYRFGDHGDDATLGMTLEHSLNLARSAFCMMEFGCRTPVIENILYLGLPLVQRCVFDGNWAQMKKQKIWSNNR